MKVFTTHIGEWIQNRVNSPDNPVSHKMVADALGLAHSSIFDRYAKADWKINELLTVLEMLGHTLDAVLLPEYQSAKSDTAYVVTEPEAPYNSESIDKIKLERDLLRARIEDKDALIQALQAQLAR